MKSLNLSGIEKDLNDQIIPGCLPEELGGKSKKYVRAELFIQIKNI